MTNQLLGFAEFIESVVATVTGASHCIARAHAFASLRSPAQIAASNSAAPWTIDPALLRRLAKTSARPER
jgi:hypothetical protein